MSESPLPPHTTKVAHAPAVAIVSEGFSGELISHNDIPSYLTRPTLPAEEWELLLALYRWV